MNIPYEGQDPGVSQLRRLGNLIDVVYAIVVWRLFDLIPRPREGQSWESLSAYFSDTWLVLIILLVSLGFTIVYWLQSNTLFSALARTDARHSVLSIAQVFSLLIFLYSLTLGTRVNDAVGARAFESLAAANVGFWAAMAWRYATKNRRLLRADVTDLEVKQLANRITVEPITAAITIPFAYVGSIFWELSWFAYPVVAGIAKRRSAAMAASKQPNVEPPSS